MSYFARFAFVLLLLLASAQAQSACPSAEPSVRNALAKQALALRIVAPFAGDPRPEARSITLSLQRNLAEAVIQLMKCENNLSDPFLIQKQLVIALHANKPKTLSPFQKDPIPESAAGVYGSNLQIAVRMPGETNRFLCVQITFDSDVGNDNALLLFEKRDQQYLPVVDWQSNRFREWSDLFGDFFTYAVVPGTSESGPLLAVAHGHPWPTSRFSEFNIDLIEPATASSSQKTVAHLTSGYDRSGADPVMLATADGFNLHITVTTSDPLFPGEPTDDPTEMGAAVIIHYKTTNGRLTRISVKRDK